LQILAIPSGIARICALHAIPNQGIPVRENLFSIADGKSKQRSVPNIQKIPFCRIRDPP
jgi:hypothetical protein